MTVVGLEKVLKMFEIDRMHVGGPDRLDARSARSTDPRIGRHRAPEPPGLIASIGQRTILEGKPAVAFLLRFVDGVVFLGPMQVGRVPPLF